MQRAEALAQAMLDCQPTDQASMAEYRLEVMHCLARGHELCSKLTVARRCELKLQCRHIMNGLQTACLM